MERCYLALRFAQFCGGGKTLANGLSVDLASQTEVRAVAGFIGMMTMAVWLSTTALDGGDGATAKITQLQNLRQDIGALLFESGEGNGQNAPPIYPYVYIRSDYSPKKRKLPN
jgi:hypothetical protein